jgi:hypothetical protein
MFDHKIFFSPLFSISLSIKHFTDIFIHALSLSKNEFIFLFNLYEKTFDISISNHLIMINTTKLDNFNQQENKKYFHIKYLKIFIERLHII